MASKKNNTKNAPKSAALATLDPTAIEAAQVIEEPTAIEAIEATATTGVLPTGYVSYCAHDPQTGSVFVVEAKAERAYLGCVIADTPLGRKAVRFTSDFKAAIRYAKQINDGRDKAGCSSAIVAEVVADARPHRERIMSGAEQYQGRNRKAAWEAARVLASAE